MSFRKTATQSQASALKTSKGATTPPLISPDPKSEEQVPVPLEKLSSLSMHICDLQNEVNTLIQTKIQQAATIAEQETRISNLELALAHSNELLHETRSRIEEQEEMLRREVRESLLGETERQEQKLERFDKEARIQEREKWYRASHATFQEGPVSDSAAARTANSETADKESQPFANSLSSGTGSATLCSRTEEVGWNESVRDPTVDIRDDVEGQVNPPVYWKQDLAPILPVERAPTEPPKRSGNLGIKYGWKEMKRSAAGPESPMTGIPYATTEVNGGSEVHLKPVSSCRKLKLGKGFLKKPMTFN
ncbi:Hypothetical predicted protein [Lecanosticta acicola]|uniref:Uncharacterized protein n=1 Tax=Lecanosticta acicola TaxID=111012 RepID=A0AAI9EEB3_9PEZI|nr:Hypothetical predicted protein [Lecanosticta acicola]